MTSPHETTDLGDRASQHARHRCDQGPVYACVLLLLLPLLQFIGLPDNSSGATSTPTSQAAAMSPLPPASQAMAAKWINGAAHPAGGR